MKAVLFSILPIVFCSFLACNQSSNNQKKRIDYKEVTEIKQNALQKKNELKYSNITQTHIYQNKGLGYEIRLGLNSKNKKTSKRKDFFYKVENEKTVIYDSWLEYGFLNGIYPCSPNCNTNLFVYTMEGAKPLKVIKLVEDTQNVCGEIKPLIWVEHKKIEPDPLFVTTMNYGKNNFFIDATTSIVNEVPDWINYNNFTIPLNAYEKSVKLYQYGDSPNTFIAEVSALGWNVTIDEDKFGPSREIEWQALYYVDKNSILILTPVNHKTQSYFGNDFSLVGFSDINQDGTLDIIIGKPVSLILESYKDGFRSWGFAFFPPGGC